MSKATRTIHAAQQGKLVKHEETFEDNLLPSSVEIKNLQSIRPDLVDFVVESARKEQDVRHKLREQEMSAYQNNNKRDFIINIIGLVFAFVLMGGFMGLSYDLIIKGHTLIGSIFAATDIIFAIGIFIRKSSKGKH